QAHGTGDASCDTLELSAMAPASKNPPTLTAPAATTVDGAATAPLADRDTLVSEPAAPAITVDPSASIELTSDGGDLIGGRFQILGLLGRGGMGCVYKVKDLELGEVVALKMLRKDRLSHPSDVENLREEVR